MSHTSLRSHWNLWICFTKKYTHIKINVYAKKRLTDEIMKLQIIYMTCSKLCCKLKQNEMAKQPVVNTKIFWWKKILWFYNQNTHTWGIEPIWGIEPTTSSKHQNVLMKKNFIITIHILEVLNQLGIWNISHLINSQIC